MWDLHSDCRVLAARMHSNRLKATDQPCMTAFRYVGSVTPAAEEEVDTLRPRTQALGTDLAASMLAQSFASPSSSGIQQLCTQISTAQALKTMPGVLPHHHILAEAMPDQIAAALVSVVDRSAQCSQQSLGPQAFIPHVVHQFVSTASTLSRPSHIASGPVSGSSSADRPKTRTDSPDLANDRCVMAFMGDVCGRFCRRGYASIVAETCWQLLLEMQQSLHNSPADSHHQHHHTHHQQQQQQQQQLQQQISTNESVQQQQQQQQQLHTAEPTNGTAALSPASEQVSSGVSSHHATGCVMLAVQDPTAMEKLLSCLLHSASRDLQHLGRNAALLRTVVQPVWAQETVRYLELIGQCPVGCIQA